MKNFIAKYRLFAVILTAELVFLMAGVFSALTTERIRETFYTQDMEFVYRNKEAVTLLDDGSMKVQDGSVSKEVWRLDIGFPLPAGRYIVSAEYEAENIDLEHTYLSVESPSNLLKQTVPFSDGDTMAEGEIVLANHADDVHIGVLYGGTGALSVKSISVVEAKRSYQLLKLLFGLVLFDFFYLLLFTDCLARQKEWKAIILGISGIVVIASMPMFMNYVPFGHDIKFHMIRITGIADGLREGQFPVRMYTSVNRGYGYPASVFYGDILLYLPALLCIVGCPLYAAYRIYVVFINLLTCLISYGCFGRIFGSRKAGMLGAFLYTCSVYRIVNVYFRAAVGEYSAMTFFPLLLYAGCLLVGSGYEQRERDKAWLWLAIGASGLCQTHVLSTELCFFFWILFMVLYGKKLLRKQAVWTMLKALAAALVLNLWFLVPFLKYFITGEYTINSGGLNRIQPSGLYLYQIAAIFLKGGGASIENSMRGEMPISPGFSLILGLLVFLGFFCNTKEKQGRNWKLGKSTAVLGILALWFSSIYCPWDQFLKCGERIVRFFFSIQFSWRYLSVATLFLTATTIAAADLTRMKKGMQAAGIFLFSILLVHGLSIGSFYMNYLDQAREVRSISRWDTSMQMDALYLPVAFQSECIQNAEILCEDGIQAGEPRHIDGLLQAECVNISQESGMITLPLIYYPNYKAWDTKGNQLPVLMAETGCVAVELPGAFADTVTVSFQPSLLWRMCEGISWSGFAVFVIYGAFKWNAKRMKKRKGK